MTATSPSGLRRPHALLLPRVIGALSLRPSTYRDVAVDPAAGVQAGSLVLLDGVVEAAVDAAIHGTGDVEAAIVLGWVLAALIGWMIWSGILWVLGVRVFGHPAAFAATARAVAFAHATSVAYAFALAPGLTPWAGLFYAATLAWFAAALHAAIRGSFEVSGRRAAAILGIAIVAQILLREAVPWGLRLVPGGAPGP